MPTPDCDVHHCQLQASPSAGFMDVKLKLEHSPQAWACLFTNTQPYIETRNAGGGGIFKKLNATSLRCTTFSVCIHPSIHGPAMSAMSLMCMTRRYRQLPSFLPSFLPSAGSLQLLGSKFFQEVHSGSETTIVCRRKPSSQRPLSSVEGYIGVAAGVHEESEVFSKSL